MWKKKTLNLPNNNDEVKVSQQDTPQKPCVKHGGNMNCAICLKDEIISKNIIIAELKRALEPLIEIARHAPGGHGYAIDTAEDIIYRLKGIGK